MDSPEFTGLIKLLNGQEIIGQVLICEDEEGFIIENPFSVDETIIETPAGEMIKVDLRPWIKFAHEEIFFLEKSKVLTVYQADERIYRIYKKSLRKYLNIGGEDENKVNLTEEMGFKSKVSEARYHLEKLYKQS